MTETFTVDTVVLGGGIMGASAALALVRGDAERGRPRRRTLLLDAFAPGHTRGSSHGDGRIVRFTYAEAVYLELARRAYPGWRRLERDAGVPILEITGGWEHGPADCRILDELARALADAEIPFDDLTAAESRRRFPQFRPAEPGRILYQRDGAIARADTAVAALWRLVEAGGGTLWTNRRVEEITATSDRVTLTGDGFAVEAGTAVVAAGGWTSRLLADSVDLPFTVCREVVAHFPVKNGSSIDHRVGAMPTMIDYQVPETPFYALPILDVPGVKIGWHHTGPETDPDDPGEVDEKILARLHRQIEDRFPHLIPEPIEVTTCLYTNTPDYHFVIDRHPSHERVIVASGFSGHGFKFAPAVGEILADLATDRDPGLDLATFAISRFTAGSPLERRRGA